MFCADIRQKGRFAGFSLYVSKNGNIQGSMLCYKNGLQLPPLNFTSICTKSGRYVIFYNERLNGVVYPEGYEVANVITELCNITVQGNNNTFLKREINIDFENNKTCFSVGA